MHYEWAFLPMEVSNQLLDDPEALRARLAADGYLYFHRLLDRERIATLRRHVVDCLVEAGWIRRGHGGRARCIVKPLREGDPEFFDGYDRVQRLEEFHTLAHDERLLSLMETVFGRPTFPHPLKIARLIFPGNVETSTPPHQDYPNNQGTAELTATWIPLEDFPPELGGLAILRGSHTYGTLPLAAHWGPGNRCAVVPRQMLEECRWVTTEFSAGDVLVFPSQTVHAATHNASELFMRLSVDFRYQPEGAPLTPVCLEPHFGRLTWGDVYEGWSSTEHQYYWMHHDYTVEPFRDFEILPDRRTPLKAHTEWQQRIDTRYERRLAVLAADEADDR
jgi:ectoine hydroxylase-related dioxygenase (phytanoyl-CoA dioxygenase family)